MIFGYKPEKVRGDFPVLSKGIIYFDNACMTLKPKQVIAKMDEYYNEYTSCGDRSIHRLAECVQDEMEGAREGVRKLLGARSAKEIIFTRNTTEAINVVSHGLRLGKGDEVILSDKEHNSNLIPWLRLKEKGVKVLHVPTFDDGSLDMDAYNSAFSSKTKLVSMVHQSNADGVMNPIKEIGKIAHSHGVPILVDGAQSVPGIKVDVKDLDCDFLAFSGHKMCGPTGTGALYGKFEKLDRLDQFIVGGHTVKNSTYDSFIPEDVPMRFEAGLSDYAGLIGFGEACKYITGIGQETIHKHEVKLNKIITEGLDGVKGIELLGPKDALRRAGIFSFNIKGMDPHQICKMLDASRAILTRSGAHCVHSYFNKRNMKGTCRASVYLYNTETEAQIFVEEVKKISKMV